MDNNETNELFQKRWEKYKKLGMYKYALFLGTIYALTVLIAGLLWQFKQVNIPFSKIFSLIDQALIIKTISFFAFGLAFGIYHFRKSEKKYKNGL